MTLVRLYLFAVGAFSAVTGLAYMIWPVPMAALTELQVASPTAVIDVQGFYGGQLVGLGGAVLLGLSKQWLVIPALVVAAASLGGTALGRVFGILMGGSCPPLIAGLLALEATSAIAAVLLLRREHGHAA